MKGRLALVLWAAMAAQSWAAAFAMKVSATVNGPWILAGDVLDPAPEEKAAKVKIRRLGPPGSATQVSRDLVFVKLRDARLGGPPVLSGGACLVTASERFVPGQDLAAFGERYLRQALAPQSGTAEVEVKLTAQPKGLKVPDLNVRLEIKNRPGQALKGNVLLRVGLMQDNGEGSEIEVGEGLLSFLVKVRGLALKASRGISRREGLSSENTVLGLADVTFEREAPYGSLEAVEGLTAKAPIPMGKLIVPSMLARPAVVKRGDIVSLSVRSGLIVVETQAKVLRDGAEGDSIPVEIVNTKKQVQAIVQDARTLVYQQ